MGRIHIATRILAFSLVCLLSSGALIPTPSYSAHKLSDSLCYDCHAVGGAKDLVVLGTRLIKKDSRILELQGGGWTGGNTLPCVYCHDSDTSRTNMVGIKIHFSPSSISRHPVDYLISSQDSIEGSAFAKCRDCHDQNIAYVAGGSALNPDIHGIDAELDGWSTDPATSQRKKEDTWSKDPFNTGANTMCTDLCHFNGSPQDPLVDDTGSPVDAGDWHGYNGSTVSLESLSGFVSAGSIGGCLSDGSSTTGCHSPHSVDDNTSLISLTQDDGTDITPDECGACHTFDDGGAASDFEARGHGFGPGVEFPACKDCHDATEPHFLATGGGNSADPMRLKAETAGLSGFSSPALYDRANCNNCHAGHISHTAHPVGCLDCHAPHGKGVSDNLFMLRRSPPVASPSSSIFFRNAGDYYDSSSPPQSGVFTNFVCDNEDCHGGNGPGAFADIVTNVHPDVYDGCNSCHQHTGESFAWSPGCTGCHDYPPTSGVDHSAGLSSYLGLSGFLGAHDGCLVCHGKTEGMSHPNYSSSFHSDGNISMNGDSGYDNAGGCDTACHANDAMHQMGISSTMSASLGSFGPGRSQSCWFCHDTGSYGARAVPVQTSSHLDPDGSGSAWSNGECKGCHTGHVGTAGSVTVALPPSSWNDPSGRLTGIDMQARLGIAYGMTGHNGISLGGTGTAAAAYTTEAEMCWGCHSSLSSPVSEWGFNTKTNPTVPGFSTVWGNFTTQGDGTAESKNYGWIYQNNYSTVVTDWTTGYWMSEYDINLKRRIASVHSANFDTSGQSSSVSANVVAGSRLVRQSADGNPGGDNTTDPVLEGKGDIRCSYCHDVHDTFGPSGKPYLRGNWVGDPYPPELPPRTTYTYTTRINTLSGIRTPRALSTSRDRGGYFIDQNSGRPTDDPAMDTLAETAGLCTLCHGTDVDTMDFYTGATLWRFAPPGKNGHSNAALGGTGDASLISDLFTGLRYGKGMAMQSGVPNTPYVCGSYGSSCDPEYPLATLVVGRCDINCRNLRNSGWFGGPVNTQTQGGGDYANWYGSGTIGGGSGAGTMAHKFTCSKCHSPHATGLPALLAQNCIDPRLGSHNSYLNGGLNLIANNCHRKTLSTDGWHNLAPAQ